jgi:hypothetical protein
LGCHSCPAMCPYRRQCIFGSVELCRRSQVPVDELRHSPPMATPAQLDAFHEKQAFAAFGKPAIEARAPPTAGPGGCHRPIWQRFWKECSEDRGRASVASDSIHVIPPLLTLSTPSIRTISQPRSKPTTKRCTSHRSHARVSSALCFRTPVLTDESAEGGEAHVHHDDQGRGPAYVYGGVNLAKSRC